MPKEVTPTNTGTKTVYVLDIYTPITLGALMEQVARLPERGLMLLPSADEEAPDDLFPNVNGDEEQSMEPEPEWESAGADQPPLPEVVA